MTALDTWPGCRMMHCRGRPMAMRALVLCLTLCGLTATTVAQTAPAPEHWVPVGHTTQTITGSVTFTPTEISFQSGKSLSLVRGGQMLFRPGAKKKKVMADIYSVTPPGDPVLENGNKLCKGKPVTYVLVWKSEKTGTEADPRTLAPFAGPKLNPGSPDDCGRYTYDAGR